MPMNITSIHDTDSTTEKPFPKDEIIIASGDASGHDDFSFRGEAPLPCLYRNNSNEIIKTNPLQAFNDKLSESISIEKKYRKTSTALSYNVSQFSEKFGLKNLFKLFFF